ncbi:MAG TPA: cobalt transporter [Nitrospirae bacterium]|nr:cobalt transporter [Nitrospirota bacterium]
MVKLFLIFTLIIALLNSFVFANEKADEKWKGVDEVIIEKIAKEHGREPSEPIINTEQGDLLLFLFLLAGLLGGFAMGYYWRIILEQKRL